LRHHQSWAPEVACCQLSSQWRVAPGSEVVQNDGWCEVEKSGAGRTEQSRGSSSQQQGDRSIDDLSLAPWHLQQIDAVPGGSHRPPGRTIDGRIGSESAERLLCVQTCSSCSRIRRHITTAPHS
jgi:hypothetical protein